jgi:hypothetical protein
MQERWTETVQEAAKISVEGQLLFEANNENRRAGRLRYIVYDSTVLTRRVRFTHERRLFQKRLTRIGK